jgi:hypothetical protein
LATRFHKDFKIIVSEEHGAQYLKPNPTAWKVFGWLVAQKAL